MPRGRQDGLAHSWRPSRHGANAYVGSWYRALHRFSLAAEANSTQAARLGPSGPTSATQLGTCPGAVAGFAMFKCGLGHVAVKRSRCRPTRLHASWIVEVYVVTLVV